MEDINLTGVQIIDHQRLKQSGRLRLVIELTEKDALQYCGSFAVAEQHEHISNVTFKFTEAQGENNGYEGSLKKAAKEMGEQEKTSIFQELRRACIEYTSEAYYNEMKEFLGVKHLKDLVERYGTEQAYKICEMQILYIFNRINGVAPIGAKRAVMLAHPGADYDIWDDLFYSFNVSKHANDGKNS